MPKKPVCSRFYVGAKVRVLVKVDGKPVDGVWTVIRVEEMKSAHVKRPYPVVSILVRKGKKLIEGTPSAFALVNPSRPPALEKARREYEAKHWGVPARGGKEIDVAEPKGALVDMGEIHSIAYTTEKKGDGPANYVHEFEGRKPRLAFDMRKRKKRLFIVGGSYDVKDEGIVG